MNMNIRIVAISNRFFMRDSLIENTFLKNAVVTGKTPFFVIGQFCFHHSICPNIIDFWHGNDAFSMHSELKSGITVFVKGFGFP